MSEPIDIQCPECDMVFYVVWNRNPIYEHPENCPFCGEEIDYRELAQETEAKRNAE